MVIKKWVQHVVKGRNKGEILHKARESLKGRGNKVEKLQPAVYTTETFKHLRR
jgi:hypothetical protein